MLAVESLVITPERTYVGREAKATVTLNRAADAGGVLVVTSSSNSEVAGVEPRNLTIPAGSRTGTFDIRAFGESGGRKITQNTVVIIEAKINGVGKSAGMTVEP